MFKPVEANVKFPALEAEILAFWKERTIYQKSLAQRADAPRFIFYEGPPTANGMPHPGHCLTRAIKDVFPRYQTMRGKLCERKAGWDTHGLPVEVEVCKELGIHSKEEIEAFGVEPFIHKCQQSVWRYMQEWERLTERIGFWVDLKEAYVTYHQSYVESVWWSLKQLFDRGLLYQGHKIVWWWAQGGTALSSGEVGQGYREVADPSVYVKFPIVMDERAKALGITDNTSLLVWTTTPWTLPSNQFAAVHPDLEYSVVIDNIDHATTDATKPNTPHKTENHSPGREAGVHTAQKLIIASALVETIAAKVGRTFTVERNLNGIELIGVRYLPPFDYYQQKNQLLELENPSSPTNELSEIGIRLSLSDKGLTPMSVEAVMIKYRELADIHNGFDYLGWRIVPAGFVTTGSGTGIVHIAPAFGEVDYEIISKHECFRFKSGLEMICAVGPDGKFTQEAPDYSGRWVKDCDKDIARDIKKRGLLFHQEQYLHEYPFCWRAENDPLIQYPRESWFIKTTAFKDAMLANNSQINWFPEHIRDGRFGNFLVTNVDWALSRERYWGTPLPIWFCDETGQVEAVSSYDELLAKPGVQGTEVWEAAKKANPNLPDDLKVHKPYIDAITYNSNSSRYRMKRVSEVIDCWYDSGAMPFAQWGYPQQNHDKFAEQFPADFISEAIDQTRGWFYSQLAISTLLFGKSENRSTKSETNPKEENSKTTRHSPAPHSSLVIGHSSFPPSFPLPHPFRNCIVLGLMLGEDGQKMSKSKRNYREPNEIFDRYGADALRWYFFANQPPWTSIRYSERAIKESIPEFLLRLWNVYSFFVIYANIDEFDAKAESGKRNTESGRQLAELDRWILSELNATAAFVTERMDAYDNFAACGRITEFVDALSNWYVRRSRDRFWSEDKRDPDKLDAYRTLFECLLTTAKLVAPFVPFIAEAIWQNLAVSTFGAKVPESVHLCDYPTSDTSRIDAPLSKRMALVREVPSLGRAARMNAKLKVRQPLAKVEVILAESCREHLGWLSEHAALIADELNVKSVEFAPRADQYITYTILPDLKKLGPKLGKRLPSVKQALAQADGGKLLADLESSGVVTLNLSDGPVALDKEDIQVRLTAKEGWAAAQGKECVVVLSTEISEVLLREGLARELVHAIQTQRKESGFDYTDRIQIGLDTDDKPFKQACEQFRNYIMAETLAIEFEFRQIDGVESVELQLGESQTKLSIAKAI